MITKFKLFENISQKLKIGDFVICKYYSNNDYQKLSDFISKNIGILMKKDGGDTVKVEYFPISNEDKKIFRKYRKDQGFDNPKSKFNFSPDNYLIFDLDEVEYWSNNKEELETLIQANKYNL